jgi:hypothetical protein
MNIDSCRWPTRSTKSRRSDSTLTSRFQTPHWTGRHPPNSPTGVTFSQIDSYAVVEFVCP